MLIEKISNANVRCVTCGSPEEATCTFWMEPGAGFFGVAAGLREVTGSGDGWRGRGSTSFTGCWWHTHTHIRLSNKKNEDWKFRNAKG